MVRARKAALSDKNQPELMAILSITKQSSAILNLDDLYKFITEAILQEHGRFQNASIWIYDSKSKHLVPKSISGPSAKQLKMLYPNGYQQELKQGILGFVYRKRKSYFTNNTASDPHYLNILKPSARSELCIPILEGKHILGLLDVQSSQTQVFTNQDVLAFQMLADHIANSIKNARVYEELKNINQRLLEFQILGRQISATLDLQEILSITVQRLPEILSLRLCSIFLHNPITNTLDLKSHNHPDLLSKNINLKMAESRILSQVIGFSKSQWIQNIESEYHRRNRPKYRTKSSLNLILKAGDKLVGVLNLNDKRDSSNFTEHDFNLADYFASHLALSINNCHLYQRTLQMALFDGLTGLYVHRYFQETLDREVARSSRNRSVFSLIMADVDHFKEINDRYGHQNGDTVLRELADIFKSLIRQIDFAARYGGEEFAFILPDTDKHQAKVLATRIQREVGATRFRLDRQSCRISLSFGIAENDGTLTKDELIRRADQALYAAKRLGRNLIVIDES